MRWAGQMSLALSLSGVVLLSSPFMAAQAEALPEELRGLAQPPRGFQLDPSRYKSALVQEDSGRADSVPGLSFWNIHPSGWRPPAESISISSSESNCRLL